MTTYEFRCATHGTFDERLPLGTAPRSTACPWCGAASARVWNVPLIGTFARRELALIDATERSAGEPEVVTAPPPRDRAGRRPTPSNPVLSCLPRP